MAEEKAAAGIVYNCIRCGGQFYSKEQAQSHDCKKVGVITEDDIQEAPAPKATE